VTIDYCDVSLPYTNKVQRVNYVRSVNPLQRFGNFLTFKMAAIRHF